MASKAHIAKVRRALRHRAKRMKEQGLDPSKPEDVTEYVRRLCDRVTGHIRAQAIQQQ